MDAVRIPCTALMLSCACLFWGCASDHRREAPKQCEYGALELTVSHDGDHVAARVSNGSGCVVFLLPPTEGVIWTDEEKHVLYVDQSAYTWRRENDLRGGWSTRETGSVEVSELAPGAAQSIIFSVGNIDPSAKTVEVRIPVFTVVGSVRGRPMREVEESLAKHELILSATLHLP